MTELQRAVTIHFEYRAQTDQSVQLLNTLRTAQPFRSYPATAKKVWRDAMLAYIWGTIATALCGGRVNYVENWRTGK